MSRKKRVLQMLSKDIETYSLRHYISGLPVFPFPRQSTLEDQFFNLKVKEVLDMSPKQLRREVAYVVGMGPVTRKKFLTLLEELRTNLRGPAA